jgi:hypothetical protein
MPNMLSREALYARLLDILRRHVRYAEDVHLTDVDLIITVYNRFIKSREDYILDPNE